MPFCADRGCDADSCDCGFFTGSDADSQLRSMLAPEGGHINPDEIAFLVLEPVQGVGGYRFPSEAFVREVADVTDTYDIPLVVDESSRASVAPARSGRPTTTRSNPT